MKKNICFVMISFMIMFLVGLLAKYSFANYAGVNARTMEDVSEVEFSVDPMTKYELGNLLQYEEEYVEESTKFDNIVVVEALGEFGKFGILTEKARIVTVYKGVDYQEGESLEIARVARIEQKKSGKYLYHGLGAPMSKGKKYLCFLKKYKKYENVGLNIAGMESIFSIICLEEGEEKLFSSHEKYKFCDIEGIDILCETKEVNDVIVRIKKRIVKKVMETYK